MQSEKERVARIAFSGNISLIDVQGREFFPGRAAVPARDASHTRVLKPATAMTAG